MQFSTTAAILLVLVGAITLLEAYPQQAHFQRLPYYPPPSQAPHVQRARRQALGGSIKTNPSGGQNARLDLTKAVGDRDNNLVGQIYAAGNTKGGPVATGGILAANSHGLGASIAKEHVPGVRDTFTKSVNANLFSNGPHSLDANAFSSHNKLANGFEFDRKGYGLDYSHTAGHAASITHSKIPNIGSQLDLGGKANIWSSQDKNTRLDLNAGASKWLDGPLSNQKTDFNGGLSLSHYFRG